MLLNTLIVDFGDAIRRNTMVKAFEESAHVYILSQSDDQYVIKERGSGGKWEKTKESIRFDLCMIHCGDQHLRDQIGSNHEIKHEIGFGGSSGFDSRCEHNMDELPKSTGRLGTPDQIYRSLGELLSDEAHQLLNYVRALVEQGEGPKPDLLTHPKYLSRLPALAILCQGYLAVHARRVGGGWGPPDIEAALHQMGYTSEVHEVVSSNIDIKRTQVSSPDWWDVSDEYNTVDELVKQATEEWNRAEHPMGWDSVYPLFEHITQEDGPLNTQLVASAYCALVERLGGEPCQ